MGITCHKKGYVMQRVDKKYIFQHTLAMESHIGRKLLKGEHVRHINGVKNDNRIENLQLWTVPHPHGIKAKDALEWAKETILRYQAIEHLL